MVATRMPIAAFVAIVVAIAIAIVVARGLATLMRDPRTRSGVLSVLGAAAVLAILAFFVALPVRHVTVQNTQAISSQPPTSTMKASGNPTAEKLDGAAPTVEAEAGKVTTHLQRRGQPAVNGAAQPDWAKQPPPPGSNPPVFVVRVGPEASLTTLKREADQQLVDRINEHLLATFGPGAASAINVSADYVRSSLVNETYTETRLKEVSPGTDAVAVSDQWYLVEMNDTARKFFAKRWSDYQSSFRLQNLAGLGAVVLMCVGTVFGYLKFDQMSAGQYRGRLRMAAAAALLGITGYGLVVMAAWSGW